MEQTEGSRADLEGALHDHGSDLWRKEIGAQSEHVL
jgi:hypothetical protein